MDREYLARMYQEHLEGLMKQAELDGICIRVSREPLQPLAMGHARHVVETWPARHQPAPAKQQ